MKQFAFFLPQFHQIVENDEWWGKGFTEWTNVKAAKPLYKNHNQPNLPLNNNYYNLLEKDTVEWQSNLMKAYGVDGLIYYHYFFNGKKLLEKPAENLLKWKDIPQHFFFCWANHSWYRSWEGSKELLLEQTYGNIKDWEEHFNYLLPFFKDERYEKKNNKPLFMIFNSDFKEKKAMFDYFEMRCIESGFDGIYIIESLLTAENWPNELEQIRNNKSNQTEKIFLREHMVCSNIYKLQKKYYLYRARKKIIKTLKIIFSGDKNPVHVYDGNTFYDVMIHYEPIANDIIRGIFFEWDNTPRHKKRGFVVSAPKKEKYFELMDKLKNEEYVFINAWNEWAEGMMLEPTQKDEYKYLEWILEWRKSRNI